MKKTLIILATVVATTFGNKAVSQTNLFPKTPTSVVAGFYHELSLKPKDIERSANADKVFEKYFDKDYVEYGGKGNKRQNYNEFKAFITGTMKQLPNVDVTIEELVADGNMVVVKIKLKDEKAGVEINYLAMYFVQNGKLKNRYAYSDGGF